MTRNEEAFATAKLIRDLYSTCMTSIGRNMADSGLSAQQAMVVRLLAHGQVRKVTDLCREMSLTKGTVSGILARMEDGGLIEKYKQGGDGRNVYLRFTDKGRRLATESRGVLSDSFDRLFSRFTDDELAAAKEHLAGILGRMQAKQEEETWTED
jgi:DNA-binding MarR family transcriptional regulator